MEKNRISYSGVTTYLECSEKFRLHYQERLRSTTTTAALLFGSAVDKALEFALKTFPDCSKLRIQQLFIDNWSVTEINGMTHSTKNCDLIKYSKADNEMHIIPYESLKLKGLLIIDAFFDEVLPLIEKVISVQEEVSLVNDNGDAVTGFCDAVLQMKGYKQPLIIDFKTAGRKYDDNSVKESPQLSLYKHCLSEKYGTHTAGYIVFNKTINKNASKICTKCKHDNSDTRHKTCNKLSLNKERCEGTLKITYNPKVDVQILIDDIDETFENKVLDSFDNVNTKLQECVFEQNFNSCWGKYGKCQYMDYCKNGSFDGLIKVESSKRK